MAISCIGRDGCVQIKLLVQLRLEGFSRSVASHRYITWSERHAPKMEWLVVASGGNVASAIG